MFLLVIHRVKHLLVGKVSTGAQFLVPSSLRCIYVILLRLSPLRVRRISQDPLRRVSRANYNTGCIQGFLWSFLQHYKWALRTSSADSKCVSRENEGRHFILTRPMSVRVRSCIHYMYARYTIACTFWFILKTLSLPEGFPDCQETRWNTPLHVLQEYCLPMTYNTHCVYFSHSSTDEIIKRNSS